ncbi:MAG: nicotinate-nucleotide adenylyltransferase [Chloroflexota bacterium]
MEGSTRVGVLGGTFVPILFGHLAAAEDVALQLELETVLFVPNGRPPHKDEVGVSQVADRVAMVELAVADNTRFAVSTIEIERPGPSYTLDTLRGLQRLLPCAQLFFLLGADALPEFHTWHEPFSLLAEFQLVIMDRDAGRGIDWTSVERHFPDIRSLVQFAHVAQLEISGKDVRHRVATGRPIRYLVPPAVDRYIRRHDLYSA